MMPLSDDGTTGTDGTLPGGMQGYGRRRAPFEEYSTRYDHVAMRREDGIIELRLHTDGGPLVWGDGPHSELGHCFFEVGSDPDNRVVILTGTDGSFIDRLDESWFGAMTPELWGRIYTNGVRLMSGLMSIEVPVVAAVNGPAKLHAEIAAISDIVLASESAFFQDAPHFRHGTVPGDSVHVIWPMLLGPNRGRVFLLTGQRISAEEAKQLGIVAEVTSDEGLSARAWEVARDLARQPTATLRYTRAALNHSLRLAVLDGASHGLALEGLGAQLSWPLPSTGD